VQVVIDIPEDVLNRFYREFRDLNDCVTIIKALEKATPLPNGHGRLIDCDELKEQIRRSLAIKSLDYLLPAEKAIVEQIDHITTIIPEDKDE